MKLLFGFKNSIFTMASAFFAICSVSSWPAIAKQAATTQNLRHCQQAVEKSHPKSGFGKIWTINRQSKAVSLNHPQAESKSELKFSFDFSEPDTLKIDHRLLGDTKTTVTNQHERIHRITSHSSIDNSVIRTTFFHTEDGVCYPSKLERVTRVGKAHKHHVIIAQLCVDLHKLNHTRKQSGGHAIKATLRRVCPLKLDLAPHHTPSFVEPDICRSQPEELKRYLKQCDQHFADLIADKRVWDRSGKLAPKPIRNKSSATQ